jgi:outer membrane lipoprotein-sorting protein
MQLNFIKFVIKCNTKKIKKYCKGKKKMLITKLFLLSLITIPYFAKSQTAYEIVKKAENAIKGETSVGTFVMNIKTPDYERSLTMKAWWVGTEKSLIVITSPPKEAGNKTLKIGNEIWSYLKNTETTIKIPPSMMLSSWNGSDYTNDDLARESKLVRDYNLKLMFEEKISGEMCWKIELTPKTNAPVVWGKLYYWVRKKDFLPTLVQYYNEKDKLQRTMKFSDFKMMGGRKIPCRMLLINNRKKGYQTELIYKDVKFNVKIKSKIFSFRELEK